MHTFSLRVKIIFIFSSFEFVTGEMSKRFKKTIRTVMKTIPIIFLLFCSSLVIDCKSEDVEKENTDNNPYEFHIGGVLSSNASEGFFKQTIEVTYRIYRHFLYVLNRFIIYMCVHTVYIFNLASKLQHAVHETR